MTMESGCSSKIRNVDTHLTKQHSITLQKTILDELFSVLKQIINKHTHAMENTVC